VLDIVPVTKTPIGEYLDILGFEILTANKLRPYNATVHVAWMNGDKLRLGRKNNMSSVLFSVNKCCW